MKEGWPKTLKHLKGTAIYKTWRRFRCRDGRIKAQSERAWRQRVYKGEIIGSDFQ
jgi:hypothetical protein